MTAPPQTARVLPLPLRQGLPLVVEAVAEQGPAVRSVRLVAADGAPLPEYVPGSHLLLACGGTVNAYSLTGSGAAPGAYTISVLRRDDGAGGSRFVHELVPGDVVRTSRPRNGFPPHAIATHHLLVAGGIGVTPILSHVKSALMWGHSFTVLYAFRDGTATHLDELRELCGDRLTECPGREALDRRLAAVFPWQPMGTHLYLCGGAAMVRAVLDRARRLGWPEARLHCEIFDSGALEPGDPFTVHLERTGRDLDVASGLSLLEALEEDGHVIPNLCRQGVCGECRLAVTSGVPLHRDSFLSAQDRATNTTTMPCVSRAVGDRLGVDL